MGGEQYVAALAEAEGEGAGPAKRAVAAVRAHASEEERFAQEHAAVARAGAGFLVVEASREDAERVRQALDSVDVTLVREYGTLTIADEL